MRTLILFCVLRKTLLTESSKDDVLVAEDATFSNSRSEEVNNSGRTINEQSNAVFKFPEDPEFEAEQRAGDPADMFGTNRHHSYPAIYKDFGRRFVPQYPYHEDSRSKRVDSDDLKLLPVKASPELVLRVAMDSAIQDANDPKQPQLRETDILRTGDYWNGVWKEDNDPQLMLRSFKKNKSKTSKQYHGVPKLSSVRAEITPGSKLYQLVSVLKKISPRLLYVINNKN